MDALRPILGMALLGGLIGWILGRLTLKAVRIVIIAAIALVALELVGFHIATMHLDAVTDRTAAAASATRSYGSVVWRLALYNLPFTLGFLFGFWKALPFKKRRK